MLILILLFSYYLDKILKKTNLRLFEYSFNSNDGLSVNILEVETIDDPPKLSNGKGSPVKGNIPVTVEIFAIFWNARRDIKPVIIYFSKSEFDTFKIWLNLIKKRNQRNKINITPRKPKLNENAEKIKSVVSTGTNILSIFSTWKYWP